MLRYAFFVIRHRVYTWLSASPLPTAAARHFRHQPQSPTASTSVVLEQPSRSASNNSSGNSSQSAKIGGSGICSNMTSQTAAQAAQMAANKVRPIVISGPSGGGKSTILAKAMKEFPDTFAFSISHTTRKPRPGEQDGEHYHFVERGEMEKMIGAGQFFEHAEFGGNHYGTSKKAVEDICASGRICVLDVELQGVHNFKRAHFDAKFILIQPPSIQVLEQRLRQRGTESEESIGKRLKHAEEDLKTVQQETGLFDCIIINDQLDQAYAAFLEAISDQLRAFRQLRQEKMGGNSNGTIEHPATGAAVTNGTTSSEAPTSNDGGGGSGGIPVN